MILSLFKLLLSLAEAVMGKEIYELVSGGAENMDQWRNFVRDLEIEVVASDMVMQMYNEIRLSIDGNNDGQATDLELYRFWRQVLVRVITMR